MINRLGKHVHNHRPGTTTRTFAEEENVPQNRPEARGRRHGLDARGATAPCAGLIFAPLGGEITLNEAVSVVGRSQTPVPLPYLSLQLLTSCANTTFGPSKPGLGLLLSREARPAMLGIPQRHHSAYELPVLVLEIDLLERAGNSTGGCAVIEGRSLPRSTGTATGIELPLYDLERGAGGFVASVQVCGSGACWAVRGGIRG
jgi:hypothetical protein